MGLNVDQAKDVFYRMKCQFQGMYDVTQLIENLDDYDYIIRMRTDLIPLSENELTTAMLVLPNKESEKTLLFVTKFGNVRRNKATDFINIKANGKRAVKENDSGKLIISIKIIRG